MPTVSVLMPVYNGERYLRQAIESILNQTYRDFEFLIILEAETTDNSYSVIKSYNDKRIRLIVNETKLGLAESLNKGIDLAKGKYIARMDCDDISLPKRLQYQVNFMEKNKDIIMCGTFAKQIPKINKKYYKITYPLTSEGIRFFSFFCTPFIHPSVIFRRKQFIDNNFYYNSKYVAEDLFLWIQVIKNCRVANIPKELIIYRINNFRRSKRLFKTVLKQDAFLQRKHWKELNINYKLKRSFLCFNLNNNDILEREILLKELSHKFINLKDKWKLEKKILFELYTVNNINKIEAYIRWLIYIFRLTNVC